MDNKINAWLEDILRSIDEIYTFLPEKRDFFEFQKDIKTKKCNKCGHGEFRSGQKTYLHICKKCNKEQAK